jgi:hypothetical protein
MYLTIITKEKQVKARQNKKKKSNYDEVMNIFMA